MTAVYQGNASFTTSISSGVDQVVEATALTETTTVVASSVNPSTFGQTITLTATVSGQGGTPSGSVEFRDGATLVGTAALDGNGVATLDASDLAVGDHQITAVYPGDDTFSGSTSAALTSRLTKVSPMARARMNVRRPSATFLSWPIRRTRVAASGLSPGMSAIRVGRPTCFRWAATRAAEANAADAANVDSEGSSFLWKVLTLFEAPDWPKTAVSDGSS